MMPISILVDLAKTAYDSLWKLKYDKYLLYAYATI